jgi:hypothetical protein
MKIGSVKYSHAEEVLRRTYPDGKTSSQALLAHVDWKVEAGESR